MSTRPSRHQVFMEIANKLGELSTCDRKAVGAVLVKSGRCISWGYNGAPPSLLHCSENDHGWADDPMGSVGLGCRNATHAEANALAFAARQGISTEGAMLYVTVSPCETCARLLIAAGVVSVVYSEPYRDRCGLDILIQAGLRITSISFLSWTINHLSIT